MRLDYFLTNVDSTAITDYWNWVNSTESSSESGIVSNLVNLLFILSLYSLIRKSISPRSNGRNWRRQQRKNLPMATERIEQTILRNLLFSEVYYRKVVPFIKAEYFQEYHEKIVYEEIADFASKYDKVPTQEVLAIIYKIVTTSQRRHFKIQYRSSENSQTSGSITNGCSTPQKSGVKIELYTSHSCNRSKSQTEAIRKFREMRYPRYSKKPWQYRSTNT